MQRASLPLSTSVSRKNSIGTSDDATTNDGTTSYNNPLGLMRAESDTSSLPLSWFDGPESSENPRPMLVHCSAGCGRTGAFCTVDSVIDMLKRQRLHMLHKHSGGGGTAAAGAARRPGITTSAKEPPKEKYDDEGDTIMDEMGTVEIRAQSQSDNVDKINNIDKIDNVDTTWLEDDSIDLIAHTVEDFRGQRLSIVQSLRQFVLCYETVLEWIRQLQDSGAAGVDARGGRGRSATLHFS
jgi:protein-tyrosine phosphatase